MKILVADDHAAVRLGLKHILQSAFSTLEFAEASTSAEALKLATSHEWDMIILDIDLPGRNGLDVLKQLQEQSVQAPVLIFSFHHEDQFAVRALKAGAWGFLSKDAPDTEIIKSIRQILSGRKYITLHVAEIMASQLTTPGEGQVHELLSDREYETFLLLAAGKTVSEIASQLSLGIPTISTYRSRVLEKMQMKNNAELTRYAMENKLI